MKAFGFASVYPPIPHPLAFEKQVKLQKFTSNCVQPLEVLIQPEARVALASSGNTEVFVKTKVTWILNIMLKCEDDAFEAQVKLLKKVPDEDTYKDDM